MKYLLYFHVFILLITGIVTPVEAQEPLPFIRAANASAKITIDKKSTTENWGISPKTKPDVYKVACKAGKKTQVTFITDLDSISYTITVGQKIYFNIILNEKDTALTGIEGAFIPDAASFSSSYIKKNQSKVSVNIPEAKELLQIIFAITPTGLADTKSYIINHDTTAYYLDVLKHFTPYKEEPIVGKMDSLLKKGYYINLKMDICVYQFNTKDQLQKDGVYDRLNITGIAVNLIDPFIQELNEFSKKSGFRNFYKHHKKLYDSLTSVYLRYVPVKQMWDWCEQQFSSRYNSYRVFMSPLVKGNHSTIHLESNGFHETSMFIRPTYNIPNVTEDVQQALLSRIVFTEIDHNYVNPETEKYIKSIDTIFNRRNIWANGKESNGYRDPYNLFNEYMTWALYVIYCYDKYKPVDFSFVQDQTVKYMTRVRGFPQFEAFTNTLLELYKKKMNKQKVADLYSDLISWCNHWKPTS